MIEYLDQGSVILPVRATSDKTAQHFHTSSGLASLMNPSIHNHQNEKERHLESPIWKIPEAPMGFKISFLIYLFI
jgi:hypothetical protein